MVFNDFWIPHQVRNDDKKKCIDLLGTGHWSQGAFYGDIITEKDLVDKFGKFS